MSAHPDQPGFLTNRERGSALLIILTIIGLGAAFLLVSALNKANQQIERDKITAAALAQAKEALIGFAASVNVIPLPARPGDLPCPDLHPLGDPLEGQASPPCNGNALGRLPWKTLGLPDVRDSSGERLWYAVSSNFKNNPRTGTINSDSNGTITVRDPNGNIIFDGSSTTGAIAVIIAPSAPITRQDGVVQTRTAAGYNTANNYLDIGNGEDNANFIDNNVNGFIQGSIKDAAGVMILNDQLITITPGDLMPALEKRVAGEVRQCLIEYAANNQGRYPWVAPLNPGAAPNYSDTSGNRFGRVPDVPFTATNATSNVMTSTWGGNCNILFPTLGWWVAWKEMVFYALAAAYQPVATPMPTPGCGTTGTCLAVNPPSATANKQVAIFVAGRRLAGVAGGQPRTTNSNKGTITNYLENQNSTPGDDTFECNTITPTFNDAIVFTP